MQKLIGLFCLIFSISMLFSCQPEEDAALALEDIIVGQWESGSGSAVVFYDETTGAAAGSVYFDTGGACTPGSNNLYTFDYEIRTKQGLDTPVYFTYTLPNCNYNALYDLRPVHEDTLLFNPGGPGEATWVRAQ